jgi:peptidyl-prolyl cis-trans isomerase D
MFDFVTKHKRVAQVILFLMAIPFVFFGVDYYFRSGAPADVLATVGEQQITRFEFDDSMREQQDQMRRSMGSNFDPAMFDNPEVRFALLEQLINQKLLAGKAAAERFRITDGQLQQYITTVPAFQEEGKFSLDRYRQLLASQNMTPAMFEQRLRQDLVLGAVQEPVIAAHIVSRPQGEKYLNLLTQQREVAIAAVDPAPFIKDVKIDDAQVRDFYDKNAALFQTPEQVQIEYVLLTQDALAAKTPVDEADVRKQYEANIKQYSAEEERGASHILIAVKPDATDEEKAAAKKQAEEIYAKAKANPAKFADLAKEFSKDPGSAEQGGDLGNFARGSMVKPFEDAVFAAKEGELLPPVQTDFGWHVIKVTGVRPPRTRPFDEVKTQIEDELKKQKVGQKFAAAADQFQNLVYEQADSLAGAGKALDLKVEQTPLVTRAQVQAIGRGNPKFAAAVFSPESIQGKRNTEAIEVAPNTLIAGRILEYKPAAPRPFDEVKDEIRQQLVRKSAGELAQQAGLAKLALLEQGKSEKEADVTFAKPLLVGRGQFQAGISPDVLTRVFQLIPDKLPAYTGGMNERGGYSIAKVTKVVSPSADDQSRLDTASARLSEQLGRELMNAYLASLRAKAEVKINQANLDKK